MSARKQITRTLRPVLISFVVASALLTVPEGTRDFGLNAMVELLSILLVLFVIDVVAEEVQSKRAAPANLALFREAVEIENTLIAMMSRIADAALTPDQEELRAEIVRGGDPLKLAPVLGAMDLQQESGERAIKAGGGVTPATWAEFIGARSTALERSIGRFMSRYVALAPPYLTEAIQSVERTSFVIMATLPVFPRVPMVPDIGWQGLLTEMTRLKQAVDEARLELKPPAEPRLRSFRLLVPPASSRLTEAG